MPESTGGVEKVVHQLAVGMVESGLNVKVLSLTNERSYSVAKYFGYEIHKVPILFEIRSSGFSLKAFSVFRKLAKEVDIINYHYPWPFMDLLHFIARVKTPSIVTYHSDVVRQKILYRFYLPLEKFFLRSVDKIICSSPNYLLSSSKLMKYFCKTVMVTFGLRKSDYPYLSNKKRKEWSAKVGKNFFLFIGVLRYYKGLHTLIEAARYVPYTIVIAGSGPLEAELKKKAKTYGLTNIHFVGYITEEDKVALLNLAYAVILPSHLRSEAFGISLLEGLMFGKPLISAEIGSGTTFINISGETGIVTPPSDSTALAYAMAYLSDNPEDAKKMGRNSRRRFYKIFKAEEMVKKYINLYTELL